MRENERYIEFGKRDVSLIRLRTPDLQGINDLFVEPEGYQGFEQRFKQTTENHILIVAGQERSGKLMTALYLAQHLWPNKELEFYLFADRSNKTLLEIISDENLPGNAIILFDDVFSKDQIKLDNLTNPLVHLNEDLANLTNVWFIFTVLNGPILDALLQATNFPILFTRGVNCQQVLEKLIDSFFPEEFSFENERAELLATREKLNPRLTPSDLRQLFDTKENDLKALINALTKKEDLEHKAPQIWFNELKPMNYQLYALLVVLFDKLDMPTVEEIYTEAVNALRRQGMDSPDEFIDPRRIGTNFMHTELGIQVRFSVMEFRSRIYRQYVEAQVENFQRLLWSLIDPDDPSPSSGLVGLIHRLSKYDMKQASRSEKYARYRASSDYLQQLRYAIAVMIAQVGVYHLPKLDLLLGKLVHDDSAPASLTAALVLAEIARRGKHLDFIEKLLKAWCQSGNFDQMWAAAASIAYIYEAIARTQEDKLAPLIEQDEEIDEEGNGATMQDQKQRWKGYLAKLRDMLTELVKIHDHFSEETINEERRYIYVSYRERLRQLLEADSEPVTGHSRPFKDLNETEQERYLNLAYAERKRVIDEAVQHDINVLTNSWKNQMRMVLMQALEHIAQVRPRDVTRLVRVWLDRKDTEDPLWQIGHMVLVNGDSIKAPAEIVLAGHADKDKVVKIFYCYARKDKSLRDELEKHLATLVRSGQVITWHDRKILPGTEWKNEIGNQLDTSDIILLLISPNFIQSDYCYSIEMQQALERHRIGAVHVIPLILRPCDWKKMPINTLQALPENGKPVSIWRNRDDAFQNIVKGIRQVIDAFYFTR